MTDEWESNRWWLKQEKKEKKDTQSQNFALHIQKNDKRLSEQKEHKKEQRSRTVFIICLVIIRMIDDRYQAFS